MKNTAAGLPRSWARLHQLQTMVADPAWPQRRSRSSSTILASVAFKDTDERLYPNVGAYLISPRPLCSIARRSRRFSCALRVTESFNAPISRHQGGSARGEVVFSASDGLGDGFAVIDATFRASWRPQPVRLGFSAARPYGGVIYTLGAAIPGVAGEALEPLHLLPSPVR